MHQLDSIRVSALGVDPPSYLIGVSPLVLSAACG
jgi:hypothetical protein